MRALERIVRRIGLPAGTRRDSAATAPSGANEPAEACGADAPDERAVRAIAEASPDGILVADAEGRIAFANRACERLFGRPARDLAGARLDALIRRTRADAAALPPGRSPGGELLAEGEHEAAGMRGDGTPFPCHVSVRRTSVGGEPLSVCVVRERAEAAGGIPTHEHRERELRLLLERASTATWRFDPASGAFEWSDNLGPLFGLPSGTGPSTRDELAALVHEEDRADLLAAFERAAVAGLDFSVEFRTRHPDGSIRWLETRAHVLDRGGSTPALVRGLTQDVTKRKKAEEEQRALAEASAVLGSALPYREALKALAGAVAGALGDWCAVHLADGEGALEQVAMASADERFGGRADSVRFPVRPDARYGPASVIRTGRPEVYGAVPDALLADMVHEAEQLEVLKRLRVRSAIAAPIALRSRIVGAVTLLAAESGRQYGAEDLPFAEELARRAALAFDNALMHENERRAREEAQAAAARARRLQSLIASLAEAATSEEIAEVLVREGAAALEADGGVVYLLDEESGELVLVAHDGYPGWFAAEHARMPLGAPNAIARAARARMPRWFEDAREQRAADPGFVPALEGLGYRAFAVLPLASGPRMLGAVGFSFVRPRTFTPEERDHLTALAGQCALAVERAQLYEREHRVAVALQHSLLPTRLPEVEGVVLAVRYLSGSRTLDVGGDWFDAIALPSGRLAISIGDVVGRGVHAAAAMAQLRNALRAYALEGMSPAAGLSRLDTFSDGLEERSFATALCVDFDPASGEARFASAGHLPPLLLGPGPPRLVEGARGVPVGVHAEGPRTDETIVLEPGSTLVLYTDGLVETHAMPLVEGLAQLTLAAASAPREPHALLEHLLRELRALDPQRDDDVAVLAIYLEPRPARLEVDVDASPAGAAALRLRLGRWLRALGLEPDELRDVAAACAEACSAALEGAGARTAQRLRLEAVVAGRELVLRAADLDAPAGGGVRPPPRSQEAPPPVATGPGAIILRRLLRSLPAGASTSAR